jgi:Circularly permutated YpsA SLOG family
VPTQFQTEPQQMSPVRTSAEIFRGLISSGLSAASSTNKGTAPDAILTGARSTDPGDEWRVASHDDGVSTLSYFRDKSISGGQTRADEAALDSAVLHDIPHDGWCPKGRKAEDAPLEARYLLTETPSSSIPSGPNGMFGILMAALSSRSRRCSMAVQRKPSISRSNTPWLHIYRGGDRSPQVTPGVHSCP